MSATQSTYVEEEGIYRFHMEHPVPAYLVALVAGDLQPADIGPRYSHCLCFLLPPGAQALGGPAPVRACGCLRPHAGASPAPPYCHGTVLALPGPPHNMPQTWQPWLRPLPARLPAGDMLQPEAPWSPCRFLPLRDKGTKRPHSVALPLPQQGLPSGCPARQHGRHGQAFSQGWPPQSTLSAL